MVPPAAKGTAQVLTACVAGMREEANPAVAAPHRAVLQISTIPQDGIHRQLILTDERKNAIVLVPILAKRENFRDGYRKTARFSVKILIVLDISSSYSLDAKASRGRARIFHALASKFAAPIRANNPSRNHSPDAQPRPACPSFLVILNGYLKKK